MKAEQNIPIAKLCVYTSIRFSEEIKCFLLDGAIRPRAQEEALAVHFEGSQATSLYY